MSGPLGIEALIKAKTALRKLRETGEAFRVATVESGALNKVPQDTYFKQLREFETALADAKKV